MTKVQMILRVIVKKDTPLCDMGFKIYIIIYTYIIHYTYLVPTYMMLYCYERFRSYSCMRY